MADEKFKQAVFRVLRKHRLTYVKELGKGSFGDVMLVTSAKKEQFAIKVVRKENYCMAEEILWPKLSHPNILTLIDVYKLKRDAGTLFVMPLFPKCLHDVVTSSEFTVDETAFLRTKCWFKQILTGLEYLHSSGFCHLDLKTDNVLIDCHDNAVICDFSGLHYSTSPVNA